MVTVLSTHGRWFTISHNDNSRGTNRAPAFVSTAHAYTDAQIHKMGCCGVEDRGGVRENARDPTVASMTGYFQYLHPLTQVLKAPADTSIALNSGWGQFVLRQTTRAAHASPSGQREDKSPEGARWYCHKAHLERAFGDLDSAGTGGSETKLAPHLGIVGSGKT